MPHAELAPHTAAGILPVLHRRWKTRRTRQIQPNGTPIASPAAVHKQFEDGSKRRFQDDQLSRKRVNFASQRH
jgi:hypothetical protein